MSCFKQPTANNGKRESEKEKLISLHKNARALGPNENLLQAVTIEAKAVLLNGSLSHKSHEVQAELL